MKKNYLIWLLSLLTLCTLFLSACKDDEKEDEVVPLNKKDGVRSSEVDSLLKLTKNAGIDSIGVVISDEIPDFDIIRQVIENYPMIKVSLNLEHCTGIVGIPDNAFKSKNPIKNLVSVLFPDKLTRIGAFSFNNCPNLNSIVIPKSVTEIGCNAFPSTIKEITIESETPPMLHDGLSLTKTIIFVPESAVETYKKNEDWEYYAKHFFAIGQEPIEPEPDYMYLTVSAFASSKWIGLDSSGNDIILNVTSSTEMTLKYTLRPVTKSDENKIKTVIIEYSYDQVLGKFNGKGDDGFNYEGTLSGKTSLSLKIPLGTCSMHIVNDDNSNN